jgi:hypothetical protein
VAATERITRGLSKSGVAGKIIACGYRSLAVAPVRRTLAISCEAPIWTGFVSFIVLFDGMPLSCC